MAGTPGCLVRYKSPTRIGPGMTILGPTGRYGSCREMVYRFECACGRRGSALLKTIRAAARAGCVDCRRVARQARPRVPVDTVVGMVDVVRVVARGTRGYLQYLCRCRRCGRDYTARRPTVLRDRVAGCERCRRRDARPTGPGEKTRRILTLSELGQAAAAVAAAVGVSRGHVLAIRSYARRNWGWSPPVRRTG